MKKPDNFKPVVAVTMGDPVGVGPETVLRALASGKVRAAARPVVVGDRAVLGLAAARLGLREAKEEEVVNLSSLDAKGLRGGRPSRETAAAMVAYVEEAVRMATSGECDAVATAPINKEAARLAGFDFPGHTEFLAHLTGTRDFVMMLGGERLKVALVTIHEPIRKVPGLITGEKVLGTLEIVDDSFRRYFTEGRPRMAVCGLNPHAGEGGLFGSEEEKVIAPAVGRARRKGIDAVGPLPPDTVFFRAVRRGEFDCVVCMYHDQGLIPLKLLHFEDAVNVTLGLPVIRTSVDHGTAYDIAWKGEASEKSLAAAIVTAAEMAGRSKG